MLKTLVRRVLKSIALLSASNLICTFPALSCSMISVEVLRSIGASEAIDVEDGVADNVTEAVAISGNYWLISIIVVALIVGMDIYQRRLSFSLVLSTSILIFHPHWIIRNPLRGTNCAFNNVEASETVLWILIALLGYKTVRTVISHLIDLKRRSRVRDTLPRAS